MKAALLPDRGVIKVAGIDGRKFLNGLVTADLGRVAAGQPRFAALLTPQGKILADFIVVEADPTDGGGFFLDAPRALARTLTDRLNFYKLRANIMVEDLSETLGVMAIWEGQGDTEYGLCYPDPRLPELGTRCMLPPHLVEKAAADLGSDLVAPTVYEVHRIGLGVPRGGLDFVYGDTFPHESNMDQLHGVDFDKGCFVGQEVVSRIEHRAVARARIVPVGFEGPPPEAGMSIMAGDRNVGMMGSGVTGRGLAKLRLDRVEEALASGASLEAGGIKLELRKASWARFAMPGKTKAAE
jgi:tRNA-modifying protein YgfZ